MEKTCAGAYWQLRFPRKRRSRCRRYIYLLHCPIFEEDSAVQRSTRLAKREAEGSLRIGTHLRLPTYEQIGTQRNRLTYCCPIAAREESNSLRAAYNFKELSVLKTKLKGWFAILLIVPMSAGAAERLTISAEISDDPLLTNSPYPAYLLVSVTGGDALPVNGLAKGNFVIRLAICGGGNTLDCAIVPQPVVTLAEVGDGLYSIYMGANRPSFGALSIAVVRKNFVVTTGDNPPPISAFGQTVVSAAGFGDFNSPKFSNHWDAHCRPNP